VLVIEVDHVDSEPLQARLASGADIIGPAADAPEAAVLAADVAELGGEEDAVAAIGDGAPSIAWWMVAIDSASSPAP
jgi:hypothetical protein